MQDLAALSHLAARNLAKDGGSALRALSSSDPAAHENKQTVSVNTGVLVKGGLMTMYAIVANVGSGDARKSPSGGCC